MTCQNCEVCACKQPKAGFEIAMEKAGANLQYIADHSEHPQAERLLHPNRVAVGEFYVAVLINHTDASGDRIYVYENDHPDTEPAVYINSIAMGLWNPDAPPPLGLSLGELMDQFHNLLHTSFFQG